LRKKSSLWGKVEFQNGRENGSFLELGEKATGLVGNHVEEIWVANSRYRHS
jgi:hypothetical protein